MYFEKGEVMSKYLVISADGHAGPPASVYREIPRPRSAGQVRRAPADDG